MGIFKFVGGIALGAAAIIAAPVILPAAAVVAASAGAAVAGTAAAAGAAVAAGTAAVGTAAAAVGTAAVGTAAAVGTTVAGAAATGTAAAMAAGTVVVEAAATGVGATIIGTSMVGSAVVGAAANAVNDDYIVELNRINKAMEKLAEATNRKHTKAKSDLKKRVDDLGNLRREINSETLQSFVSVFGKLKKVEFEQKFDTSLEQIDNIKKYVLQYNDNSSRGGNLSETSVIVGGAVGGAIFGGFFLAGSLMKGVKLQGEIEEAKMEHAKLKAQAEKVKMEIAKLNEISKTAEECIGTSETLKGLLVRGIAAIEEIIENEGADYSKYKQPQREIIRTVVNLACAVKDMVSMPLLDANGDVNPQMRGAITDSTKLAESDLCSVLA